jgi:signal transduction histidine kinase
MLMHFSPGIMKARVGTLLVAWALLCGVPKAQAADTERQISVWIISAEGATPNDIAQGEDLPSRMEALRLSLAGTRVRLLNVEAPLAAKTGSWFPEYTVPNFAAVANQRTTFAALARFAAQNNADIVLRLITWREAFDLLRAARTAGPDALPDVMEVGTTWTGYLAANGRIRSRPDWQKSRGNWRDVLGVPACALPLITDVRLLFYWKRLPSAAPDSPPLTINNSSWPALLDSVASGTSSGETVTFPTGISLNLLYDYVSLVMAGGSQSILHKDLFGSRLSLSSQSALAVPVYLAEHSWVPLGKGEVRQLVSFPETTHEEVTRTFVNGGYRTTLEPASFMARWAYDFYGRQRTKDKAKRFWDYAAAVIPPGGFKGGGELVVLSKKSDPALAFKLADFLATDAEYTDMLVRAGFLVSGKPGYGSDSLVASLVRDELDVRDARIFGETVRKAIDQGHRYPDFERWPVVIEDRPVLEKLQHVWRAMAEGDGAGVRKAAKEVDWAVNSQIYLPARALNAFIESWRLVALVLFLTTFLVVLGALHRLRLRQLERQFSMRLEERLYERTRIARELHDTLLQSFHGLLLRFQGATNLLPERPEEAQKMLEGALDRAEQAITEGRDAVRGLRSSTVLTNDLASAINTSGEELATGEANPHHAVFHLGVEGASRELHPISRDEVYRIAVEAIRNAFKHAQAQRIEVEIQYQEQQFRLRVRDDGKGIDGKFVNEDGGQGHYGLRGMRERAKLLGGKLTVRSEPGSGTELELSIPATNVYATPDSGKRPVS